MASAKRSTGGDEFARIALITRVLAGPARDPVVEVAIGDDAAVLDPAHLERGEKLVWTVDASIEDVHFRRAWIDLAAVGFRSVVTATSDVLAMGARPIGALIAWTLPDAFGDKEVEELARGEKEAADLLGMSVIGGNLSAGHQLTLTTTVMGAARAPRGRSGACAGDRIVLLGAVGEASLGARCLEAGRSDGSARAIATWRRPPVLLHGARALGAVAHAMTDVSDGLAQDLGHLARASGVRAVISAGALAARRDLELAALAAQLGADLAHLELAGGEDYAIVAALPQQIEPPCGEVIGYFEPVQSPGGVRVRPEGHEPDVVVEEDGVRRLPPEGWRHR